MAFDLAHYVKSMIEEVGLDKAETPFDAEAFSKEIGMNLNNAMRSVLALFIRENKTALKYRDKLSELMRRNEYLEKALDTAYNGNGRVKQMALVESGLPIAKKKKSLVDLKLRLYVGDTDKKLMEDYGISRSTLWRWKKELEEEERELKEMLKQGANNRR